MILFKNTQEKFGWIAIFLHWVIAIMIIALLIIGIYMTRIPFSSLKLKLFKWHKEFGMLVFMLAIARLTWRSINLRPLLRLPRWETLAAFTVHWMFYGFMFILPLTGWILSSTAGIPVSFFGWFNFPDYIKPSETLRRLFTDTHEWLAYLLILLICLHTAAALKHYFINKDRILQRMLWP